MTYYNEDENIFYHYSFLMKSAMRNNYRFVNFLLVKLGINITMAF